MSVPEREKAEGAAEQKTKCRKRKNGGKKMKEKTAKGSQQNTERKSTADKREKISAAISKNESE